MNNLRYLVWGYYGYGNLGDEFMLKVIAGKILKNDPGARIYVRCMETPSVEGIIPFPIEKAGFRISVLKHMLYLLRQLAMVSRIDRLIIGGGTLFLDKGQPSQSIFFIAAVVFFAKLFRKKIYVIGAGMDELSHSSSLSLLKYILDRSDYVSLRDDFSYEKAVSLTDNKKVVRSSDILFDRSFVNSVLKGSEPDKKYIVVSLSDYFATWGQEEDRQSLKNSSVKLVEALLDIYAGRYSIMLCAFQKGIGEKDFEFLSAILELVAAEKPGSGKDLKLEYLKTEADARRVFEGSVFTIGMRYHALVLSAMFKKPFLGIDIEMKINQFCGDFGMPCIGGREFIKDGITTSLIDKLDRAAISADKIEGAIIKAGLNFAWLD